MSDYKAEFELFLNDRNFLKGTQSIQKAVSDLKNSFSSFGSITSSQGDKIKDFGKNAIDAFTTLGRSISGFTSKAIKESARLQNALTRVPMFLDKFNMNETHRNELGKLDKNKAMSDIYSSIRKFSNTNINRNMSYSDASESFGTFLSGGLDTEGAKAGLKGLSYVMKLLPEVDKDTLTSSLVNTYNQVKGYNEQNKIDITPEANMDKILNTYNMMTKKFRFDLAKGENPFKVLSKSLTTNPTSANFAIEELAVLAGTMTSAGVGVAEADTSINSFLSNIPKLEKVLGKSLKGKGLIETLNEMKNAGLTGSMSIKSIFGEQGARAVNIALGSGDIEKNIEAFKETNALDPLQYQKDASLMNQSFESSEKALATLTANFEANYGRIGRGFTWMKNDMIAGLLSLINSSVDSENVVISALSNITMIGIGSIGSLASSFFNLAPAVSSTIDIFSKFKNLKDIFASIGSFIAGMITPAWGMVVATWSWAVANWALLAPFIAIGVAIAGAVALIWYFRDSIWEALKTLWDFADSITGGYLGKAFEFLKNIFSGIFDAVVSVIGKIKGFFSAIIEGVKKIPGVAKLLGYFSDTTEVKDGVIEDSKDKDKKPITTSPAKELLAPLGGGGGRARGGRASDDEIKGRGYFIQSVAEGFKDVSYSLFQGKKEEGSVGIKAKSGSSFGIGKGSEIDIHLEDPVMAIKVVNRSVRKVIETLLSIHSEIKEWRKEMNEKDYPTLDENSLDNGLSLLYPK